MKIQKDPKVLTENDVFQGKETTTVNAEIPNELRDRIFSDYFTAVSKGITSLTEEQYLGALVQQGYNWQQYSVLKKVFDK